MAKQSVTRLVPKSVDYLVEVFKYYQDRRRTIEDRLIKYLKVFSGWDDDYVRYQRIHGGRGWRSTIYFPIIRANIETLTPKIVMATVGDSEFVRLLPTEQEDMQYVEPFETIIYKQWEEMNAFDQATIHAQNMQINGFAWGKYGWKYEEEERSVKVPMFSLMGARVGFKMARRKFPVFNGPVFRALPPERIYWDPDVDCPEDCMLIIDRYFATKRHITDMEEEGDWKGTGDIDYGQTPALLDEMESTRKMLHFEESTVSAQPQVTNPWHQRAEILEAYGVSRTGKKRQLLVVANRQNILYEDGNPHANGRPPFIYSKNSQLSGQMTGASECELGAPLNKMINILRNLHIDAAQLNANGMWKVSKYADVDLNQLVSRPWGVIETNDMEGVDPVQMPPLSNDSLIEARALEIDLQNFSGVVDYVRGTSQAGAPDTATAVERLTAAAHGRFAARIKSMQNSFVKTLVRQMIVMNVANLGPSVAVRIAGRAGLKFLKFRPDNIHGDFDIQVKHADEVVSRAIAAQQKLVLFNLLRGDPEIDQRELKRSIIGSFLPGTEGRILMPENEMIGEDEENLLMANGGFAIPLPNEDHQSHIRAHVEFMQQHPDLEPEVIKTIQNHIKAHQTIVMSVYQPNQQPALEPSLSVPSGPEAVGGGQMGNQADMISAVGGQNVTQRPA